MTNETQHKIYEAASVLGCVCFVLMAILVPPILSFILLNLTYSWPPDWMLDALGAAFVILLPISLWSIGVEWIFQPAHKIGAFPMTVAEIMDQLADQPPSAEVEIVFDSGTMADNVDEVRFEQADDTRPSRVQIVGEH